jgi:hypothetical protein
MSSITLSATFSTQDILRIPQIRKALREREDSYLNNLVWLDQDLSEKRHNENINWLDQDLSEKRQKESINWLDQDLSEKRHKENINWLDQDLNNQIDSAAAIMIQKYARRMLAMKQHPMVVTVPKIWHCGHAPGGSSAAATQRTPEEKRVRKARSRSQYEDGLTNNTCLIGHRHQQENVRGNNTRKQFMKFQSEAKEGDIIFNHCSRLGGLTHYGFFTGEISRTPSPAPEDIGQGWFHSFISVYEWIPLLNQAGAGVGRNCTLYEVTPTDKKGLPTKNYHNYTRPVRDLVTSS